MDSNSGPLGKKTSRKDYYPAGVDWHAPLTPMPLYTALERAATVFPDTAAVSFYGKTLTYEALYEGAVSIARGLQSIGVQKGTRVGLFMPNCPYFMMCYYGILLAGGTVVNYNPLYSVRELRHQIQDSGTTVMITLDLKVLYQKMMMLLPTTCLEKLVIGSMCDMLPRFKSALFSWKKKAELAFIAEDVRNIRLSTLIHNGANAPGKFTMPLIHPEADVAVLQYTGGTTGTPKGARLTHANLYTNMLQASHWFHMLEEGNERVLGLLPLFHVFAMTMMNLCVNKGLTMVLHPRFDVQHVLRDIRKRKITLLPGVPTVFVAINQQVKEGEEHILSSLKLAVSGGAPLPAPVLEEFEKKAGCVLVEGYGLTEASPVIAINPADGKGKPGSVGVPLPGTGVEIRDPEDSAKLLPRGKVGEICVCGPQVMAGYHHNVVETAKVLSKDRLLHTGDLGYLDKEGFLFIVDRLKEMIIAGGYNIYPRNIEEVLYQHESVAEAAVVGVPDSYRGQTVKAFLVLKAGKALDTEEMHRFLSGKLAAFEMPSSFEIVEEMPKTMVGKISKRQLREGDEAERCGG